MSEIIEILRCQQNFYSEKGVTINQIEEAETTLGLTFALDFKECLCEYGAVSYRSHELTGFSSDRNLDVVLATQRNRKNNKVNNGLYVIEEAHIDGIVVWQDGDGIIYETSPNSKAKKIASSLAEYIEKY